MSINGPSEMTAKASRGTRDGGLLRFLRVAGLIAVVVGAVGSTGLMILVGRRNPSRVLLGLFVIWDLSPFIGLLLVDMVSKRWSIITRATLHIVMLVIALSSLALWGCCVEAPAATRFQVHCGSAGVMAAYDSSCPVGVVHIRQ
jgi:hypothetical protein